MARWIAAEKVRPGLQKCSSMLKRDGKTRQRIAQSQRARVGLLAKVDQPLVVRIGILCADVVLSFSGVMFVLSLSHFRISCFKQKRGSSFNRSTISCMRPGSHTQSPNNHRCRLFCIFSVSWEV